MHWKILKIYYLLKMGIFHCHVSWLECNSATQKKIGVNRGWSQWNPASGLWTMSGNSALRWVPENFPRGFPGKRWKNYALKPTWDLPKRPVIYTHQKSEELMINAQTQVGWACLRMIIFPLAWTTTLLGVFSVGGLLAIDYKSTPGL